MKYLDIKVDTQVASADLFAYAMLKHEKNVEIKVAPANKSKKVVTLLSGDPRLKCELINEKRDCGAVGRRGSLPPMRRDLTKTVTNGLSMTNDREMRNENGFSLNIKNLIQ